MKRCYPNRVANIVCLEHASRKNIECVQLTVAVPFPNSSMSIRDLSPAN